MTYVEPKLGRCLAYYLIVIVSREWKCATHASMAQHKILALVQLEELSYSIEVHGSREPGLCQRTFYLNFALKYLNHI